MNPSPLRFPRASRDNPLRSEGCIQGPYSRPIGKWSTRLIAGTILLAVGSLLYSKVWAAEGGEDTDKIQRLGIHLISAHSPGKPYQNNHNLGLYLESRDGWTGGFYRNTLNRTSLYFGNTLRHSSGLGLTLGAVSGYKKVSSPISCPEFNHRHKKHEPPTNVCEETLGFSRYHWTLLAAPSYTWGPARLWFIPRVGNSSSVLHLSLEHKL